MNIECQFASWPGCCLHYCRRELVPKHMSAQWSSRNNKFTFRDETALECKFWACIGWWVLSSSQCGHIINLRTLEHTENGNYQIWWCQLSKFAREYRVKSSYNLSFTLVWSKHYSNSQEATQYSYWIAFISSFKLLLVERSLPVILK